MALKPTKLNAENQVRAGDDGDLLVIHESSPEWQTPAEAGIATETYADAGDAQTLFDAKSYTDQKHQEGLQYTNDEVDMAKEEMQNYTDDEIVAAVNGVQTKLDLKADLINGKVPASQLPGYAETFKLYPAREFFPAIGADEVIYIAENTNDAYRWTGATYVVITDGIQLGETSETAYRGDRGKEAYDHTLLTDNPHQVNKAQVGLSEVDNTADSDKPVSQPTQLALDAKSAVGHTHSMNEISELTMALSEKANYGDMMMYINGLNQEMANKEDVLERSLMYPGDNITFSDGQNNLTSVEILSPHPLTISATGGGGGERPNSTTIDIWPIDPQYKITNFIPGSQVGIVILNIDESNPDFMVDGTSFIIRIMTEVYSLSIEYPSNLRAVGVALPTETIPGKFLYLGVIRNGVDSTWDIIAASQGV